MATFQQRAGRLALLVSLAALCACGGESDSDHAAQPNILIILADDLGYGDVGCYGSPDIRTPQLDRLADQGVRLTDFYVASPVCSPSRASLLTGRYPLRHGMGEALVQNQATGLDLDEVLLPTFLAPRGYVSGLVGKWHLGADPEYRPLRRGFDEFFGMLWAASGYYEHTFRGTPDLWRGDQAVDRPGEYATDLFTDEAIAFLERHRSRPWFLLLSYSAPHLADDRKSMPAPDEFKALYADADATSERRAYMAVVSAMDAGIGRVLEALDETDQADDTLLVFLSDNGAVPMYGSNAPFRGGKDTLGEGGIRVPCIVRWPARLPAGRVCTEPLIEMDLMATSLAVAGAEADVELDGFDVLPTLRGEAGTPHDALFWQHRSRYVDARGRRPGERLVRRGRWRLAMQAMGLQLHDLETDPGQREEVSMQHPDVVKQLVHLLDTHFGVR